MSWHAAPETPTKQGWYLVIQHASARPLILWWAKLSTQWRDGCVVVKADYWRGPIPMPQEETL